ncbi:MAG: bifunctional 3-deoxy-7-phosphoheptulonate synthase/chorismate mutase type II [Bacteroidia bacterium]|nr:bifunctional 3-deoxy-7-phosphoheptulonate synthase/chorismate mutase type II [Bacteroidia bacterium]
MEEFLDLKAIGFQEPFVIAGPCSAEAENQLLDVAHDLVNVPYVQMFRAGIWKPRTRPSNFEGVGVPGLAWLKRIKEETGLQIITEIAYPEHIESVLNIGIDAIWLGARTTTSPFAVEEIAQALQGVNIPVFVKNPINPDISLWIGAFERLQRAGVRKLIGIHRGFSTLRKTPFRYDPSWEIVIELKRLFPKLPILCDPSHIAGNAALIPAICQRAFDLEYNGLMIEVHQNPQCAWSDSNQQITPKMLQEMLQNLVFRSANPDIIAQNDLLGWRTMIDHIDTQLLELLQQRLQFIRQVARYKRDNKITVLQLRRWQEVLESRLKKAEELNINVHFVQNVMQIIHEHSLEIHQEEMIFEHIDSSL